MTHPGDPDYDPLRHNYLERTKEERNANDLKYGTPALDKVKAALSLKDPQPEKDD